MAFLIIVLLLNGSVRHAYVDNVLPVADCLAYVNSDDLRTRADALARDHFGPQAYASIKCSVPPPGLGPEFGRKLLGKE